MKIQARIKQILAQIEEASLHYGRESKVWIKISGAPSARDRDEEPSVILNKVADDKAATAATKGERVRRYGRTRLPRSGKVTRCARQNATSIAGLTIMIEASVAEAPKKPPPTAAAWVSWEVWISDRASFKRHVI